MGQEKWVQSLKAFYSKQTYFTMTNLQDLPETQRNLYFFVTSPGFENSIMACIVLNTLLMASQVYPSPSDTYEFAMKVGNFVFAGIFNIEAILKLTAMRRDYFNEGWNVFDFVCVIATDSGILLEEVLNLPIAL